MLYEGGRLRPPLVSLGPGFSAERVITSRRKNGEEGWKEKGRQEALVAVPPAPGVLSNDTPSFLQIARSRSRELAPRRAVPSRASANVPGGRCLAVDASNGSRNLTHERGEVSKWRKKAERKRAARSASPFPGGGPYRIASCVPLGDLRKLKG